MSSTSSFFWPMGYSDTCYVISKYLGYFRYLIVSDILFYLYNILCMISFFWNILRLYWFYTWKQLQDLHFWLSYAMNNRERQLIVFFKFLSLMIFVFIICWELLLMSVGLPFNFALFKKIHFEVFLLGRIHLWLLFLPDELTLLSL